MGRSSSKETQMSTDVNVNPVKEDVSNDFGRPEWNARGTEYSFRYPKWYDPEAKYGFFNEPAVNRLAIAIHDDKMYYEIVYGTFSGHNTTTKRFQWKELKKDIMAAYEVSEANEKASLLLDALCILEESDLQGSVPS